MRTFLVVNALFIAACVWMIILQPGWPTWTAFIASWCVIDAWLSRSLNLSRWHWIILIGVLIVVDLVALKILGQI